jgi:diketogulonate reductase-like aldo/keto reductase
MSPTVPRLPLNDKRAIPAAAFGTATGHSGLDDTDYVLRAIEGGFDHIDTAQWYKNEESVGEALRRAFMNGVGENKRADLESQKISVLTREDIWVTTKYGGDGDAEAALDTSLKKVSIAYCFPPVERCTLTHSSWL